MLDHAESKTFEEHYCLCVSCLKLINRLEDQDPMPLQASEVAMEEHLDIMNSLRATLIEQRNKNLPDAA